MFVDAVKIQVTAGNGGDGKVSFRHEIYVDKGGPDGGDGGKGGDVVFVASRNQNTLASFRYQKEVKADHGQNGGSSNKRGRSADDLRVAVPVGTSILDESGTLLYDLTADGQEAVVAFGGKGGFGNAHFVSSVRQAPRVAEKGERGDVLNVQLELRVIADVGLVGLPNAGKSSFLTAVSNARPEIADYPFTTLTPHLGVVDVNNDALLVADIPGLIEGASEGKGLGDAFLKHVSRCSVLLHLIDATQDDVAGAYVTIRGELSAYSDALSKKPEIVALTKIELLDDDLVAMQTEALQQAGVKHVYALSSYAKRGLDLVLYELHRIVAAHRQELATAQEEAEAMPVIRLAEKPDSWTIEKKKDYFLVKGRKIEKFTERTDFSNEFGTQRLRDIMKKMGIMRELKKQGIEPDQRIVVGDPSRGEITY